ncbi:MAG: AarF/ABC1/UbiB kinase family protein, partial [Syntrophomonadaceae bacterium]|nr:AarF/ABC1/UbiB kinase family protein [Syntrophomonadaceae bacterium]
MTVRTRWRHVKRYRQIAAVLMKYGLGYVLEQSGLYRFLPLPRSAVLRACDTSREACLGGRLSAALMELGPAFVKVGQMLSTRADLFPVEFIEELERLQDKVNPFPYPQVVEQLTRELGPPDQVFASFDPQPLAAASLGQVHRATLRSGEAVIVKVQRPGIQEQVENDLEIMESLAAMVEHRSPWARQVGLAALTAEYGRMLRRELDYDREAKNTERCYRNFAGDARVVIPRLYGQYSTPRVITEEYIEGVKLSDIRELDARGWDRSRISRLGTEAFLTQILVHGFFQADPHQGNMLAVAEDRIAFIDFGQMGSITGRRLEVLGGLLVSVTRQDIDGVIAAFQDLGIIPEGPVNVESLQDDIADLVERVYSREIGDIDMNRLRVDLMDLSFRYRLQLPPYLMAIFKALVTVEGVGKKLDPGFNFAEVATELAEKVVKERLSPENLLRTARRRYYHDIRPLLGLPRNFNNLVRITGQNRLG